MTRRRRSPWPVLALTFTAGLIATPHGAIAVLATFGALLLAAAVITATYLYGYSDGYDTGRNHVTAMLHEELRRLDQDRDR